jgi:hypothetical protein
MVPLSLKRSRRDLNDDRCFVTSLTISYTPFACYSKSHLQAKIICVGNAIDFGVPGARAGDEVDCFREQGFNTSGGCKDIDVTIRYKVINPSGVGGPDFDMFLQSATFGQGPHDDKNVANNGATQFNYDDLNPSPVTGISESKAQYPTARASVHNIQTQVNTCSNTNRNLFFMKMKLKPTNNNSNTTSKCGESKAVLFNRIGADGKFDVVAEQGDPSPSGNAKSKKSPKASKAPSVKKSKAPAVKTSKAPSMKTSKAPSMKTSKAPSMKTSKAPAVKTSKAPAVKTSKAPSMKTSKAPSAKAGDVGRF